MKVQHEKTKMHNDSVADPVLHKLLIFPVKMLGK